MPRSTTAPEALRTLRQRGSVAMGIAGIVIGVVMAFLSAISGEVSLVLIGFMLLLAGASWVLFVRPNVVLTIVGVELNNPFRRTLIPWPEVEDVAARWSLEVYADGKAHPAWAVASHIERHQGSGILGFGRLGQLSQMEVDTAPKPSSGATVGSASRMIESAKSEWSEMVAAGDSAAVREGEVTHRWEWLDLVCVVIPVLVVLLGFLL